MRNFPKTGSLVYSSEDIYKYGGQFDKYLVFWFHYGSDAHSKYGGIAYGHVIYKRKERKNLETIIANKNYNRTDSKILIDGSCDNKINSSRLKTEGFQASEVSQILTHDNLKEKQYRKEGIKKIPNTIQIPVDFTDWNHEGMVMYNAQMKMRNGWKLLNHELVEFHSYAHVLYPELVTEIIKEKYLLKEDKSDFKDDAAIFIYGAKKRRNLITNEEIERFKILLKDRRISRFEMIRKELGISEKQFDAFKKSHPERYRELWGVVLVFDTETLYYYNTEFPVYWDFERFIHIYIRHYHNFIIDDSTYKGTKFQYNYKDIRRIACLIIEKLNDDISVSLSSGKSYNKYGDQGYYFNGNYYTLRIDSSGRLMAFHPLE